MIIQQKRVRTLKGKLPGIKKGSTVVFGAKLVPALMPMLFRIGFPQNAGIGDAVLPTAIGPITSVNAEGSVVIHRDRPMETAYRMKELLAAGQKCSAVWNEMAWRDGGASPGEIGCS